MFGLLRDLMGVVCVVSLAAGCGGDDGSDGEFDGGGDEGTAEPSGSGGVTTGQSSETGNDTDGDPTAGDDSGPGEDADAPCADVSCGSGECIEIDGKPACECDEGYAAIGLQCVVCNPIAPQHDVDLAMVDISGRITLNGGAPPNSEYEDGNVYLRNIGTGDEVWLGATNEPDYSQVVLAGDYDVFYSVESGGTQVPANNNAKLMSVTLNESQGLDVDVRMVKLSGRITIDSGAPPDGHYEDANLYLRDVVDGDSVWIGNTRNGEYAAMIVPGKYELHYELEHGGEEVPANRDAVLDNIEIVDSPEIDQEHQIEIPMVVLSGSILVNGDAPPVSQYDDGNLHLKNHETGEKIPLGSTRDGSYSVALIPGTYDIVYEAENVGGGVPANEHAVVEPLVVLSSTGHDIHLDMVEFGGSITVDGQVPPNSPYDDGVLYLRDSITGDEVRLGSTRPGSYSQMVLPGEYQVHYGQDTAGATMPANTNAKLMPASVKDGTGLDIDIPTAVLDGSVTINGQLPPTSEYEDGRLYLRDLETGDSVLLGNTHEGSFTQRVVAGTYDVHYVVETGGTLVPANADARVRELTVSGFQSTNIDIPMVTFTGAMMVNGNQAPSTPTDSGRLVLTDTHTGDSLYLANTHSGSFVRPMVAGTYVLYYREEVSSGGVPSNKNAGLACFVIE